MPLEVDRSIDWDSVGGLKEHITALKEMVMFPLLYPEYFTRFSVTPPRSVHRSLPAHDLCLVSSDLLDPSTPK
jgi:SpoVK/Ycf46/Vps4 family AAA+-type ATPase